MLARGCVHLKLLPRCVLGPDLSSWLFSKHAVKSFRVNPRDEVRRDLANRVSLSMFCCDTVTDSDRDTLDAHFDAGDHFEPRKVVPLVLCS